MLCEEGSWLQRRERGNSTVESPLLNRRWSIILPWLQATLENDRVAAGCALALPGLFVDGGGMDCDEGGLVQGLML